MEKRNEILIDVGNTEVRILFPDGEYMNTRKCLLGNLMVNAMLEGCDVVLNGVKYIQNKEV